ncbi:MAG: efflux RND transporter periplasmic adaptor subunit, partial [Armatimonadetes bacterium]|nr:efflux RND transporter periplasmic adaptor subunit [Armatimonadota bacterium]
DRASIQVRQAEMQVLQARAEVARAEAALRTAEAELRRVEALYADSAASQAQVEQARLQHDTTRQAVASARAQLASAEHAVDAALAQLSLVRAGARPEERQAARAQVAQALAAYEVARQQLALVRVGARPEEIAGARAEVAQARATLAQARTTLAQTRVYAPVGGWIARVSVQKGDTVIGPSTGSSTVMMLIVDHRTVEVVAGVGAQEVAALAVGQPVALATEAAPWQTSRGTISTIDPAADPQSRTFAVKIAVSNPDLVLRPGTVARGRIISTIRRNVLVLPRRAIRQTAGDDDQQRGIVFVVDRGRAVARSVTTGASVGTLVEITGGLREGEVVVQDVHQNFRDGMPLRIIKR